MAEELPLALWAYNTTSRMTIGETPFSLTYGCKAMVSVEIGAGSLRRDGFDDQGNEQCLRMNLDLVEEHRKQARLRVAAYQQMTTQYYNKRVHKRQLRLSELVLRKIIPKHNGALGPKWEGPYKIKKVIRPRFYLLCRLDETPLKRAWNDEHLKKYY